MLRRDYPKDVEPFFIHWRHFPKTAAKVYKSYIREIIRILDGNPLDIVLPDVELTRTEVLVLDFALSQATTFRKVDLVKALAEQKANAEGEFFRTQASVLGRKLQKYGFKLSFDREHIHRTSVRNNKLTEDILKSTTIHREQINQVLAPYLPSLSSTPIASAHRLPDDPVILERIVIELVNILRGKPPTIVIPDIHLTENEECVFNTLISKPGLVTWRRLGWALDLPLGENYLPNNMTNSGIFNRLRRKLLPTEITIDEFQTRGLTIPDASRQTLRKYAQSDLG